MTEAVDFLLTLRPGGPWNLAAIEPERGHIVNVVARSADDIADFVAEHQGNRNLYYSANVAPNPTGWALRATSGDIPAPDYLATDVDPYKDGEGTLEERKAEALARVRAHRPPATAIIDTGGGYQPLFRLSAPTTRDVAERCNLALIEDLGGDKGTWTVERLLRLPGTLNIPNAKKRALGRVPVMAKLVEFNDMAYEDFEFRMAAKPTATHKYELDMGDPVITEDLAALAEQYNLNEALVRDIAEEGPSKGERSEHVFGVVARLVRARVPDEVIYGLLTDPGYGVSESILELEDDKADRAARRAIVHAHERVGTAADDFDRDEDDGSMEAAINSQEAKAAEVRNKKDDDHRRRVERFSPREVEDILKAPRPKWLIKGWMLEGSLNAIVGGEKTFKTFTGIDLACRMALGLDWHGIRMTQGRVLYIIGEGNEREFGERVLAWCIRYGHKPSDLRGKLRVIPVRVGLDNAEDMRAFFEAAVGDEAAVFVDTLARNMDGAENETRDMNLFVRGADDIRERKHTAVVIVHHSGKDPAKIYRGNSALVGAVDSMWLTARLDDEGDDLVLELYRSRVSKQGVKRVFKAEEVVTQEMDDDNEETRSLAMTFVREGTAEDGKQKDAPTAQWEQVLVYVAEQPGCGVATQSEVHEALKFKNSGSTSKVFNALRKKELMTGTGPFVLTELGVIKAVALGASIGPDLPEEG